MAEIIALSQREFDDREAKIKPQWIQPRRPRMAHEARIQGGTFTRAGCIRHRGRLHLGRVMASGQALPILKDGKATAQVGALTNYQDGRELARFSRSEKGQEAENLMPAAMLNCRSVPCAQGQVRTDQSP